MGADWEDFEDHKQFMNSDAYKPFVGGMQRVFDFATMTPVMCKCPEISPVPPIVQPLINPPQFTPFSRQMPLQKSSVEDATMHLAKFCTTEGTCSHFACGWGKVPQILT